MANRNLPQFSGSERSVRARRIQRPEKRDVPIFVLVIIGIYIGVLSFYLIAEDKIDFAPTVSSSIETADPVAQKFANTDLPTP
ncbi:MAG: hypothetical protein AAF950_11880 [Pseudomonadota bacterium]